MTDSVQQVWVIPSDPDDLAPLPALVWENGLIALYDRHTQEFYPFGPSAFNAVYANFEECRAAMIERRIQALDASRAQSLHHARVIEHLKFIPAVEFPSHVLSEVPESQEQEAKEQEEAQAEEVKPTQLKRPTRRSNASN